MIVRCKHCGVRNSLPTTGKAEDYQNRVFKCSKCSEPLFEKKDKAVFDPFGLSKLKEANKEKKKSTTNVKVPIEKELHEFRLEAQKNKSKTIKKEPKLRVKPNEHLNQSFANVENKISSFIKEHKDKKNGAIILAIILALFIVAPMFNSSQKSSVTIVRHNQSDESSKKTNKALYKQTPTYTQTHSVNTRREPTQKDIIEGSRKVLLGSCMMASRGTFSQNLAACQLNPNKPYNSQPTFSGSNYDYDWAWDFQPGDGRWVCRGIQTGQYASKSNCANDFKNDSRWP